jgi:putative membrane protein insertion efficiency factor
VIAKIFIAVVRFYQMLISPILHVTGARCRFHPTCSAYAVEVIRKYGALRGSMRATGRLLRCHPLHPGGFDPP